MVFFLVSSQLNEDVFLHFYNFLWHFQSNYLLSSLVVKSVRAFIGWAASNRLYWCLSIDISKASRSWQLPVLSKPHQVLLIPVTVSMYNWACSSACLTSPSFPQISCPLPALFNLNNKWHIPNGVFQRRETNFQRRLLNSALEEIRISCNLFVIWKQL